MTYRNQNINASLQAQKLQANYNDIQTTLRQFVHLFHELNSVHVCVKLEAAGYQLLNLN